MNLQGGMSGRFYCLLKVKCLLTQQLLKLDNFIRQSGDFAVFCSVVKSAETDRVLTNICCLFWNTRESKHIICITVNKMEIRQRVLVCSLLTQRTSV